MLHDLLHAAQETLTIAGRTLPVIFVSLILIEILLAYGLLQRVQRLFQPLIHFARLPAESGPALVVAFGSILSADTMVASDRQAGRLDSSQTFLAAQANTLPSYLKETFTYILPVMLPALGSPAGWFYFSAFLLTGAFKVMLIIAAGRWFYYRYASGTKFTRETGNNTSFQKSDPIKALFRTGRLFLRTAGLLIIASFFISWLNCSGLLISAASGLGFLMKWTGLEERLFLPVIGFAASPVAGAAALGVLYKSGAVTAQATSTAALAGSLLALPIFALRYSLAHNIAIFGPVLGCINVLVSLILGIIARLSILLFLPILLRG